MNLWRRLIGGASGPGVPTFPHRIDLGPSDVSMTIFEHRVATGRDVLDCWTFVSDGLLAYGQKELVLTLAHAPDDLLAPANQQVGMFIKTVHQFAIRGSLADAGQFSILAPEERFLGARGVAYARPQPLDGIDLPRAALAAVPLYDEETEAVQRFGVTRVLARTSSHERYFPWPFWWGRMRGAVGAHEQDGESFLNRLSWLAVAGLSARIDRTRDPMDGRLVIRIHPTAQDDVIAALDRVPTGTAFAVVPEIDSQADALLTWLPGQTEPTANIPEGSAGKRVSVCFIAIAAGVETNDYHGIEDGVALMLTHETWHEVRRAIRDGGTIEQALDHPMRQFALEWVRTG